MADNDPIPMRLVCEGCGELHIDEGEFATKPHHTHSCQHCGMTWRPCVLNTVGVRFLPGFKNDPPDGVSLYESAWEARLRANIAGALQCLSRKHYAAAVQCLTIGVEGTVLDPKRSAGAE